MMCCTAVHTSGYSLEKSRCESDSQALFRFYEQCASLVTKTTAGTLRPTCCQSTQDANIVAMSLSKKSFALIPFSSRASGHAGQY